MRWSHGAVALSLIAVALAGCSDGGGGSEDDAFDEFGDVDVADGKGVIRGLVIDGTITPLSGASVTVTGTQLSTTTNEKGAFLFSDVDPGTYFLEATKPGYATIQSNVEVKPGEEKPPVVQIQLQRLPGTEPRYVPHEWEGFIGCSVRRWDPPAGGQGMSCPYATTFYPDHDTSEDIGLDAVPTYVTSDLVWKSTQHLGGEMSFNLRRTDTSCDTVDVEGTSPLNLRMDADDIALHSDRCNSQGGFGPDMPLRIAIFTAHLQETEPPTGGWGFGVQLEQTFQTYTHVFYNYAPPEDWVFIEDPDVPGP